MDKTSKVLITGRYGMVGSAVERKLREEGYHNIVGLSSKELDLQDAKKVSEYFEAEKPQYVISTGAKVGGIRDNMEHPADFLSQNLMIQNNVICNSYVQNVKMLIFVASNTVFPSSAKQPLKEEYLMQGVLDTANEGYSLAKLTGIKQCEFYNRQYGTNYVAVVASNIYGLGDHFEGDRAHVVPSMIYRLADGRKMNKKEFVMWGSGKARRELMYADDLADAIFFLLSNRVRENIINIGVGHDISMNELLQMLMDIIDYHPTIVHDHTKPEGVGRKLLDSSKIHKLGWKHKTPMYEGLKRTYLSYMEMGGKQNELFTE